MVLDGELVRRLASTMNDSNASQSSSFAYGTIQNGPNSQRQVRLDGSDYLVPIALSTDAQLDDRVLVRIENHEAVVVGNLTTPASARTATDYIRYADGELKVGKLDTLGNPIGGYTAINSEAFNVYASVGERLASFGKDGTAFYEGDDTIAEYNGSGAKFYADGKEVARYNKDGSTFYNNGNRVALLGGDGAYFYTTNGSDKEYVVGALTKTYATINGTLYMTDSSGHVNEAIVYTPSYQDPANPEEVAVGEIHINGTNRLGEDYSDVELVHDLYLHGSDIYLDGPTHVSGEFRTSGIARVGDKIYVNSDIGYTLAGLDPSDSTRKKYLNLKDYFATKSDMTSSSNAGTVKSGDKEFSVAKSTYVYPDPDFQITKGTWILIGQCHFTGGLSSSGIRYFEIGTGYSSSNFTQLNVVSLPGYAANEHLSCACVVTVKSNTWVGMRLKHSNSSTMTGSASLTAVQIA